MRLHGCFLRDKAFKRTPCLHECTFEDQRGSVQEKPSARLKKIIKNRKKVRKVLELI